MIDRTIHYAGDTLRLAAQYLDADLQPKSLAGVLITAQVQILSETKSCAIQITNLPTSEFDIYAAKGATADWPRGVWSLTVTYEWFTLGEPQQLTEQVALIEVRHRV